ncbi:MAG: Asd/ArgC dimerization domain-containing protein, partial [Planctomycetota bacterium]
EPGVPLVVSQVNPEDAAAHEGIVANPNCSTMQLAPLLMALRDSVGLERVVVDTYQSVSGTGGDAVAELEAQIRAHAEGRPKESVVYPHPIAFNAIPEIDVFLDNGYSREEWKVVTENRKIKEPPSPASSLCSAANVCEIADSGKRSTHMTRRQLRRLSHGQYCQRIVVGTLEETLT